MTEINKTYFLYLLSQSVEQLTSQVSVLGKVAGGVTNSAG